MPLLRARLDQAAARYACGDDNHCRARWLQRHVRDRPARAVVKPTRRALIRLDRSRWPLLLLPRYPWWHLWHCLFGLTNLLDLGMSEAPTHARLALMG